MKSFLVQNWPYFVVPALLVLAVMLWLLLIGDVAAGDFHYPIR